MGFCIEIFGSGLSDVLTGTFSDGESELKFNINIKKIASVQLRKKTITKDNLKNMCSMQSDGWRYTIEHIWMDQAKESFVFYGWALYGMDKVEISSFDEREEVIRCSRQDVKDYYEGENVSAMSGFEIYVPQPKAFQKIVLNFVYNEQILELAFSEETLKKFKERGVEKKVRGNRLNFFQKLEMWKKEREYVYKYGLEGAAYKKREMDIFYNEANLNRSTYSYHEHEVPQSWIDLQKYRPDIAVVVPLKNVNQKRNQIERLIESLKKQTYTNFKLFFTCSELEQKDCEDFGLSENIFYYKGTLNDSLKAAGEVFAEIEQMYTLVMEEVDWVDKNFMAIFLENLNIHRGKTVYYMDYDILYRDKKLMPVVRDDWKNENPKKISTAAIFATTFLKNRENVVNISESVNKLEDKKICHISSIAYHYCMEEEIWDKNASKPIAFYLPQFHENPENNEWWGKGFTEWVNVKRAFPLFEGHNQPRVPGELGYYDLVEDPTIQERQVALAKEYGIHAFCFYYYWFEGKRLLWKPVDQYFENKNLDLPFCICWANETWSRRWNGDEKEILIKQVHNEKTDKEFIYDVIPLFKDERYLRVDGKPLLLIYRIELFPRPAETIKLWKKLCAQEGVGDIHVALVQSFGMVDHRMYGADSSVEFPPHKIVGSVINENILTKEEQEKITGNIYSYKEIVENQMLVKKRDYVLWPGCMLGWDNTARRLYASNVFHYFSPELYREWLIKNHVYTQLYNKQPLMFINAWNEWAEGTYLEPDQKYGRLLLEITKEVINYR